MKTLVLGGTRFVGAAIVDELRRRGGDVTIFTRGQTNPEWFSDVDHVRGDRRCDLERLGERRFDVVIDTCGYLPEIVEPSAQWARERGAFYLFVSTASVYAPPSHQNIVTEESTLASVEDAELSAPQNYGAAKVLCEQAVRASVSEVAILRPGLIVGPRDYTDRFYYWVMRLAEPGPVLVPGDGLDPVQAIDARDFATFAVTLAEQRTGGVFNAAGPSESATFADFVRAVSPTSAVPELVWAPAEFLERQAVAPWKDLPCWLPRDHEASAILRLDVSRAREFGLVTRSLDETSDDTRAWLSKTDRSRPLAAGLAKEREAQLLEKLARWRACE